MPDYQPEQLWPLYEKLPKDLQETIFSEKTANTINDICTRNDLEEKISEVAKYTGYVLLGILPPDRFQKALEEELKLNNDLAKKVSQEIHQFIFYLVENSLEKIYQVEIVPSTKPKIMPGPKIKPLIEEKLKETPKKDIYREPIE